MIFGCVWSFELKVFLLNDKILCLMFNVFNVLWNNIIFFFVLVILLCIFVDVLINNVNVVLNDLFKFCFL